MDAEIVAKLKRYLAIIDAERIKSNKVVKTINMFNYIISKIDYFNVSEDKRIKLRTTIKNKISTFKSDEYSYLSDNLKDYFFNTMNKLESLLVK